MHIPGGRGEGGRHAAVYTPGGGQGDIRGGRHQDGGGFPGLRGRGGLGGEEEHVVGLDILQEISGGRGGLRVLYQGGAVGGRGGGA